MASEAGGLSLRAGQIVLADWRGDTLPKEPNKRRLSAGVEDKKLSAPGYPSVIFMPLYIAFINHQRAFRKQQLL